MGQHFLVDRRLPGRILRAAAVGPEDTVIEIGPGRGALTRQLVERAREVVGVEMDPELAASLPEALGYPGNLRVVQADAREVDTGSLIPEGIPAGGSYKLLGNLPYYAANPILRHFLEEVELKPSRIVVMVQREVAESMVGAGGRMSLLAVSIHLYAVPRIICDVPPSAFRPSPKVTSSVVRLDPHPVQAIEPQEAPDFFRVVRAGFSAPRKQLRNSLGLGLGIPASESQGLLESASLDPARRPGSLVVEEWRALWAVVRDHHVRSGGRPGV
ncbi:MAG: ribosomal RNA small subunit methyltransferase A [Dehalococcoidia bacterium]|nr:ribosomal RNA small subunit methyltransferase A [Dehalococcoidia bacterium]